jgi:hypothetical protein
MVGHEAKDYLIGAGVFVFLTFFGLGMFIFLVS